MRNQQGTKVMVTPSILYGESWALAVVGGEDGGFLHVHLPGDWSDDNRMIANWRVNDQTGASIGKNDSDRTAIMGGVGQMFLGLEALGSLCSFLGACAESYHYAGEEGENANLFPERVRDWAVMNSDEIAMLAMEIETELED